MRQSKRLVDRSDVSPPGGRTRVSEAVIQKVTIAEAHAVEGVVDVRGLVLGALVGGVAGAAIGLVHGGPSGAAFGAPAGSLAGAAVSSVVQSQLNRRSLFDVSTHRPDIILKLTAQYGANLQDVASRVRSRVRDSVFQEIGIDAKTIDVEFVEIVGRA